MCSRPVRDLISDPFTPVDRGEHRLRDLQPSVHVFRVEAPGLAADFPLLRALSAESGNLPRQMTTFVGRVAEIETVSDLVHGSALVTLTGVGGVGKTRLALQVAADLSVEYRDGAWLCELAPLTNPDAVWDALAASLRVPAVPGRTMEEATLDYLATKRLLLVLDNCEHLVGAIARVATGSPSAARTCRSWRPVAKGWPPAVSGSWRSRSSTSRSATRAWRQRSPRTRCDSSPIGPRRPGTTSCSTTALDNAAAVAYLTAQAALVLDEG